MFNEEQKIIFDELFNYYINENHLTSKKTELAKQFFLLVVSITAAYNYSLPAIRYAQSENPILISDNPIHSVIGTCIPAAAVLYIATNTFMDFYSREKIPKTFRQFLALPGSIQRRIFNISCILIGSFLSGIPLTTTYITYEQAKIYVAALLSAIIQFDNTILHFLPIKLILSQPLYRLPILPFEYGYMTMKYCFTSKKQRHNNALKLQRSQVINGLLSTLNDRLTTGTESIIHSTFRFRRCQMDYLIDLPENFESLLIEDILKQASASINTKNIFHQICEKIAFLLGAIWVGAGSVGYLANPYNLMNEKLNNIYEAIGLTALPTYALTVLIIFLAGNMLRDNFNFLLNIIKGKQNLAIEIKLYPKTFVLLELANIYFAFFSYAAAVQMIDDNFQESLWDNLRSFFVGSAISGIIFLGFNAVHDFYKTILKKYTLYYGSNDAKQLMQLKEKTTQLTAANQLIKPEVAVNELKNNLTDARSATLFGVSKITIDSQIDQAAKISKKPSLFQRYLSFFCYSNNDSGSQHLTDKEPLLQQP